MPAVGAPERLHSGQSKWCGVEGAGGRTRGSYGPTRLLPAELAPGPKPLRQCRRRPSRRAYDRNSLDGRVYHYLANSDLHGGIDEARTPPPNPTRR